MSTVSQEVCRVLWENQYMFVKELLESSQTGNSIGMWNDGWMMAQLCETGLGLSPGELAEDSPSLSVLPREVVFPDHWWRMCPSSAPVQTALTYFD